MQIPGIDMLDGLPEKLRAAAFTPKLVSSVAHTYGRPHVMSEISAHSQGGKVTERQLYGTMMTQYALGVDIFHSYFSEYQVGADVYRAFHDAVGRTDAILGGGSHITGVAVYYPIETVQAGTIPHGKEIYQELDANPDASACWYSVRDTADTLLAHQIDFDFLDAEAIERSCLTEDGLRAPGGELFRLLVLPACRMTERLRAIIARLTRGGVPVLRLTDPLLGEDDGTGALVLSGPGALPGEIRSRVQTPICLENAPELVALCRENRNGLGLLVVNTADRSVSAHGAAALSCERVSVYDPLKNEVVSVQNADSLRLELEPCGALLVLPE